MIPEAVKNRTTPAQQLVDSGQQISLLDLPNKLASIAEERAGFSLAQLGEPGVDQFRMMRELLFAYLEYYFEPEKPGDKITMRSSGCEDLTIGELANVIAIDDDDENPTP